MRTARIIKMFNLIMTGVWIVLVVPTMIWWKDSVQWVALMSLWANIASHFAAYIAGRVEVEGKARGEEEG